MRVLHAADLHVGSLIRGRSRLAEHRVVLANLVAIARDVQPDITVLPGDTFDRGSPGPAEILAVAEAIHRIVETGSEVLLTSGNHDGPSTMRDVENKVTGWLSAFAIPHVHAHAQPTAALLPLRNGDKALFLTIPYPHKRSFDEQTGKTLRERTEKVSTSVEESLEHMRQQLEYQNPGVPVFFAGHLSTLNAELSADQAMRMGWDVTVRAEIFAGFGAAFLGHIHRSQSVSAEAAYSGSAVHGDFGEATQSKTYSVWDIKDGLVELERLSSGAWPVLSIVASESEGWELPDIDPDFPGWARVVLDPDRGGQPSYALKRRLLGLFPHAAGAWVDVKPRPRPVAAPRVEPEHQTNPAIVRAYLASRGLADDRLEAAATDLMERIDRDLP